MYVFENCIIFTLRKVKRGRLICFDEKLTPRYYFSRRIELFCQYLRFGNEYFLLLKGHHYSLPCPSQMTIAFLFTDKIGVLFSIKKSVLCRSFSLIYSFRCIDCRLSSLKIVYHHLRSFFLIFFADKMT